MERRSFLTASLAAAAGALVPLTSCARLASTLSGPRLTSRKGPGPLGPAIDETTGLPLLLLPAGFRYLTFGWTGDPQDDGTPTPAAHDGMSAFAIGPGRTRLIRNHEIRAGGASRGMAPALIYDPSTGGGTTTLDFDTASGRALASHSSLAGTSVNCAGGPTPWGSWLTCEETMDQPGVTRVSRPHGYIFEVPLVGAAEPEPLPAMGRFVHEATAVDPETGIVYETEDRVLSGFYRFTPTQRGLLARGGTLEMLKIEDSPLYDTRIRPRVGRSLPVEWVTIDRPDDPSNPDPAAVFRQGYAKGGAIFARLEGAWYGDERIFIVSTSGGRLRLGQVFAFDPEEQELTLVFESPDAAVARNLDNITVSPRGGLLVCEDGGPQPQRVHGLTRGGHIFPIAQSNVVLDGQKNGFRGDFRAREFAGAVFSPDGSWLFVNAQSPGITFAITGDWANLGI
ncbi:MAG: alkaline phosphatase PhoX [Vicinamibacterales bacterium]